MKINLLILIICWSVLSFNMYLTIFYLDKMSGNIYLNSISTNFSELFGTISAGYIMVNFGIKRTFILSFFLMSATALIYVLTPKSFNMFWFASILLVNRLGITIGFGVTYFSTNALFRPSIVATVFALCNIVARTLTLFSSILA